MVAALTDPFGNGHMGVTAEGLATRYGITRLEQDEFAALSQSRAVEAIRHCAFKEEILPFEFKTKGGTIWSTPTSTLGQTPPSRLWPS